MSNTISSPTIKNNREFFLCFILGGLDKESWGICKRTEASIIWGSFILALAKEIHIIQQIDLIAYTQEDSSFFKKIEDYCFSMLNDETLTWNQINSKISSLSRIIIDSTDEETTPIALFKQLNIPIHKTPSSSLNFKVFFKQDPIENAITFSDFLYIEASLKTNQTLSFLCCYEETENQILWGINPAFHPLYSEDQNKCFKDKFLEFIKGLS